MVELHFLLKVEDGWPPVIIEGVPCTPIKKNYRIERPPLFVKDLSCGDVISVSQNNDGNVFSWAHVERSSRTTIWLLRMGQPSGIDEVLEELQSLDCNTVCLPQYGSYSVDVPEECPIEKIDMSLAKLDRTRVAIAYPSFRHKDNS